MAHGAPTSSPRPKLSLGLLSAASVAGQEQSVRDVRYRVGWPRYEVNTNTPVSAQTRAQRSDWTLDGLGLDPARYQAVLSYLFEGPAPRGAAAEVVRLAGFGWLLMHTAVQSGLLTFEYRSTKATTRSERLFAAEEQVAGSRRLPGNCIRRSKGAF